jgi:hypothetical protein
MIPFVPGMKKKIRRSVNAKRKSANREQKNGSFPVGFRIMPP